MLGAVVPVEPPSWLEDVAKAVDARLAELLDTEVDRWSALDADLLPPFDALRRFVLDGGKRLRAAFCHWAFVGAGGDAGDPAWVDGAGALELLQCFALMHDDVMDDSSVRRGKPAVHADFAARHAADGWRGEHRRYGEGMAILVGDLAFVYADQLLEGASPAATAIWRELRLEVNAGQLLDLIGTARGNPSVETASRICQYKSGKYTIERPLHLGAALAGRSDPALLDALSAYGVPLGEAFQLVDDLLGAFGDPAILGKPVGDDFREGKPTRLVALGLERSTGADHELLATRLGAPDLTADEVAEVQRVLVDSGARSEVEATAAAMADAALVAASTLPIGTEATAALGDLARYVVGRDR